MDEDTPLVIGADVKVSDRFDADDELRMSFPASGRAAYFSRADVKRLRDHLTALLTEPTPPVELVVGREYRLLPNATCRLTDGSTIPTFHGRPVTRVEVISEADSVGDYMVRALDVSPGSEHYVSARYLAPLDEPVAEIAGKASLADIAQAARETGQMYARAARSHGPHSNLYRHIGEAFATFADKLEGKPE